MSNQRYGHDKEVLVRHYAPLVLAEAGACVGVVLLLGLVALMREMPLALVVTPLPIVRFVWVLLRYMTEAVIVRGNLLVLRYGALAMQEHIVPLWACAPEYHQGFPGRLLDFGTLTVQIHGRPLAMRQIASFRQLRGLIVQRQATLIAARDQVVQL